MSIQLLTNKPWANLDEWLINLFPMMNSPPQVVCVCLLFFFDGGSRFINPWLV